MRTVLFCVDWKTENSISVHSMRMESPLNQRLRRSPPDVVYTPIDVTSLVALYNATDGPNWTNNSNWLTDAPVGEWHGVTADPYGRVVALSLVNGLVGKMPPELSDLTNLYQLDLSLNQLSGEIPMELGSLTNLLQLRLNGNQISGEIPLKLGNLTNLQDLNPAGNQLGGEIPMELGSITSLQTLFLGNNQLSGEAPSWLGGLWNLVVQHHSIEG